MYISMQNGDQNVKKTHGKRKQNRNMCAIHTRQHSPRSKRAEIPAMHSHCHAYCLLPVPGWHKSCNANVRSFVRSFVANHRAKILLVMVPFC